MIHPAPSSDPVHRPSYDLGIPGLLLILGFGAILLIAYHLTPRSLTRHEIMFAQAAREMRSSGDWLIPTIAGVPWPEKPQMTFWLIAASMALTGSESEWAVRLPSAILALALAWMIAATAARFWGRRIGILAGLIQLSSYYVLHMAALAEADMPLMAGVAGCYCLFACVFIDSPNGRLMGRWTPWLFHLLLGFAYASKGPLGVAFVALGTGSFMLVRRQWECLAFFFHPGGLLIFTLMAVPYPILGGLRNPAMWNEFMAHHFGRLQGELSNHEPFYYYFLQLPIVLLPWLPALALAGWNRRSLSDPMRQLALCWLIPGVLFLSCISWKWKHYAYPLLPGLTFIMAVGLDAWLFDLSRRLERIWRPMQLATIPAGAAAIVAVLLTGPTALAPLVVMIALTAGLILIILELQRRRRYAAAMAVGLATVWVAIAGVYCLILPGHDRRKVEVEFAQRIDGRTDLDLPLHLVNLHADQIIYYLKSPIRRADDIREFRTSPGHQGRRLTVLVKAQDADQLAALGTLTELDRCANPQAKGKPDQALLLVRIEPGPEMISRKPSEE
jgi:4-amino-4-deoxy-L-arabinose transferase-like glycosyltransferase